MQGGLRNFLIIDKDTIFVDKFYTKNGVHCTPKGIFFNTHRQIKPLFVLWGVFVFADDLMEGGKTPRDCRQSLSPYRFVAIGCVSAFLKGCGGTFFAKKVPPQNLKDYNIAQTRRDEG